uniref:AlNc14C107G6270 protein n=1 Tax=Albugo laibachii Nc14 TaxID=890382 RepID=F0WI63_9STRA|nr:AlNc14C107G6270 [Albugo laibachii Nc14]|eukprot:CCA20941.1 AlNc14C107G6270 [Albugo laibachii Nc14]
MALKLRKSLYGLKQAGRLWAQLLHATLLKVGFIQCHKDTNLYKKGDESTTTLDMCVLDGYHPKQAQVTREMLTRLRMEQADPARTPVGEEHDGEDEGDLLPSDCDGKVERPTVYLLVFDWKSVVAVSLYEARHFVRCASSQPTYARSGRM